MYIHTEYKAIQKDATTYIYIYIYIRSVIYIVRPIQHIKNTCPPEYIYIIYTYSYTRNSHFVSMYVCPTRIY